MEVERGEMIYKGNEREMKVEWRDDDNNNEDEKKEEKGTEGKVLYQAECRGDANDDNGNGKD